MPRDQNIEQMAWREDIDSNETKLDKSHKTFFLVSKSKLIMCKVSTNSFIYISHRQSQVTHRVRMR